MSRIHLTLDKEDMERLESIRDYLLYSYGESPSGYSRLIRYAIDLVYQLQKEGQIDSLKKISAYGRSARKRGRPRTAT